MRLPGQRTLRRLYRRLTAPLRREAVILAYHRVADLPSDPQLLSVTSEHFAAHLRHLRLRYTILSLPELLAALATGRLPRNAVALTFDDGYADNVLNAKPLLEQENSPATVFITSGMLDGTAEFWWDELERLLLLPGDLPDRLELAVNGNPLTWDLAGVEAYTERQYQTHRAWNVLRPDDPTPRHALYRELCLRVKPAPDAERQRVLRDLRQWAGRAAEGRPTHRALRAEELCALAADGLVAIGAHTAHHACLGKLPLDEQRWELADCRSRLMELTGQPVTAFAYPYGASGDFTAETQALVREAGFACACTTSGALLDGRVDRYQLPRFLVRNWEPDLFARNLHAWFTG